MHRNETPEDVMIRNTLQDTDQSVDNMLKMLHETKQVGVNTLESLEKQGSQISGTQKNVDEIIFRDKIAKRQIRSISSFFWDLLYLIAPLPKWKSNIKERIESQRVGSSAVIKKNLDADVLANALKGGDNLDLYKKTDQKLDQVENEVKDLHQIADDMHDEIINHNNQLDVLKDTTHNLNTENHQLIKDEQRIINKM
ncbi:MAG TPA: Qb-SNARE protein [Gammaproteobacteria bacterium]|jgi:hypothetical protein|nr:Qb-SNARE protein [Gammaproteobacteria bacterium]